MVDLVRKRAGKKEKVYLTQDAIKGKKVKKSDRVSECKLYFCVNQGKQWICYVC